MTIVVKSMARRAFDTARAATSDEVKDLRSQAQELKEVVAERALELRLLKKKSMIADGETKHEAPRLREAQDHPPGREVASAGQANAGDTRVHPSTVLGLSANDMLLMFKTEPEVVRLLSSRIAEPQVQKAAR